MSQAYFQLFGNLVQAIRTETNVQQVKQNTFARADVGAKPQSFRIIVVLLERPIIYMNLLLTLVFMQTFGSNVTSKVKELFKEVTFQDIKALCDNSFFIRDKNAALSDHDVQDDAELIYDLYVDSWVGLSKENLKQLIDTFVKVANGVLGDNAGDKALVAAQTVVYGYGAATLLATYGCDHAILDRNSEVCRAAASAKAALTVPVDSSL